MLPRSFFVPQNQSPEFRTTIDNKQAEEYFLSTYPRKIHRYPLLSTSRSRCYEKLPQAEWCRRPWSESRERLSFHGCPRRLRETCRRQRSPGRFLRRMHFIPFDSNLLLLQWIWKKAPPQLHLSPPTMRTKPEPQNLSQRPTENTSSSPTSSSLQKV